MTLSKDFPSREIRTTFVKLGTLLIVALACAVSVVMAQAPIVRDPAEPPTGQPHPKPIARPAGRLLRSSVSEKDMRSLISDLVRCGTRLTLASWDDPKRGPGCGRDRIVEHLNAISKEAGGKLQITVDKFLMTAERTGNKPAHLENVYAVLPGSDERLSKTVFIVSGHFDSMPSFKDIMNPEFGAPRA